MNDYNFKEYDFEHPSILFILEDKLKGLLGGLILYYPYYKTFRLKGNENVLDFGCGGESGSRCPANLLNKGRYLRGGTSLSRTLVLGFLISIRNEAF